MCGLAGICDFSGAPIPEQRAVAMADTLVHRGPDASGSFSAPNIALAHRRLSIRDLSSAGNQPFHAAGGQVTIVYNGEIYNDDPLREVLRTETAYPFTTRCDTEVIPAAYLAWGEAAFARLNGMFAMALWDARTSTLVLARDAIGMKPLFYIHVGTQLLFASEVKALLAALPSAPGIDAGALHEFLALGHCAPDRTYLRGVRQVPPGHLLRFDATGVKLTEFWRPTRQPSISSLDTAVARLAEIFPRAIEDHLVADTPVASFQSAGIDSSLINYMLPQSNVTLITAAFDDPDFDESPTARLIAAHSGRPHIEVPVVTQHVGASFDRVLHHVDGQLADSSAMAVDGLSAASAEHFKVVLSGDGADELFGGYATYRASRVAAGTGGWFPPAWADRIASAINRVAPTSTARYPLALGIGRFICGWARGRSGHVTWRRYLSDGAARSLYAGELAGELTVDPLGRYAAAMTADPTIKDPLGQCLLADQRFYLPADMLMKVDALSMAHSLEVRLPFLDPRVLELSAKLDTALLCPLLGPTKPVLRASLARAGAGSELVQRPKTGFNVPLARLLRGELASRCEQHFDAEADRTAAWLNQDALGGLWREHRDGARDHGYALWALLTFTRWYASIAP